MLFLTHGNSEYFSASKSAHLVMFYFKVDTLDFVFSVLSIKELVTVEKDGLLFSSSSELADELLVS